jgi:predicted transcriptional regulator
MEFLWETDEASVRDVCDHLGPSVAYTTAMTTLDRLFKKGLLTRKKTGRAFVYAPAASRAECEQFLATELLDGLLERHRQPAPLSNLVDAVQTRPAAPGELERLVREADRSASGGNRRIACGGDGGPRVVSHRERGGVGRRGGRLLAAAPGAGPVRASASVWLDLRLLPLVVARRSLLIFGRFARFEPKAVKAPGFNLVVLLRCRRS